MQIFSIYEIKIFLSILLDDPASSISQSMNSRSNCPLDPRENRRHDITSLASEEDLLDDLDLEDRLGSDDNQHRDSSAEIQQKNNNRTMSTSGDVQHKAGHSRSESDDAGRPDAAWYVEDSLGTQHRRGDESRDTMHRNIHYNANQYTEYGGSNNRLRISSKENSDYSVNEKSSNAVHGLVDNDGHNQLHEGRESMHAFGNVCLNNS